MKTSRYVLLLVAGLAGAAPVQAADMAVTPTQRVEQAWSWTGFYIGGHGGYGWGRDRFSQAQSTPALFLPEIKAQGWVFGGHAGYNWQYGMLVGGLEVDFSATDIKGSVAGAFASTFLGIPTTQTASRTLNFDYLGTARARVGIAWQSLLIYGTAGPAWSTVTVDTTQSFGGGVFGFQATTTSTPSNVYGLAVGVGGEASLAAFGMSNVLLRVEYLHYHFGKQGNISNTVASPGQIPFTSTSGYGALTLDVVRGGISWKF